MNNVINWTNTGKEYYELNPISLECGRPLTKEYLEKCFNACQWQPLNDGKKHSAGAMAGMAINTIIKQTKGKPTAYAISHDLAPYGLVGVEFDYKNAIVKSYWIDTGTSISALATLPTYKEGSIC